jgi:hypothetical protein
MTQLKGKRSVQRNVAEKKHTRYILPDITDKTSKLRKKSSKSDKQTDKQMEESRRMWRPNPSKEIPTLPNELYTFEFSLSEAITPASRSALCHHLQDSIESHVLEFEPLTGRILNTCCALCERSGGRGRAESCPPTSFPASQPRLVLPKLERLRSRSVDIGVLSNKPKEFLRLPPIASPWK